MKEIIERKSPKPKTNVAKPVVKTVPKITKPKVKLEARTVQDIKLGDVWHSIVIAPTEAYRDMESYTIKVTTLKNLFAGDKTFSGRIWLKVDVNDNKRERIDYVDSSNVVKVNLNSDVTVTLKTPPRTVLNPNDGDKIYLNMIVESVAEGIDIGETISQLSIHTTFIVGGGSTTTW